MRNFTILLILFAVKCQALKILVYSPRFGKSHLMFMGKLADLYTKNGHEVVMFQPILVDNDPDINSTGTQLARVILRPRDFVNEFNTSMFHTSAWVVDNKSFLDALRTMTKIGTSFATMCKHTLNDDAMMEKLKNEQFDIGITQFTDQCVYAIFQRIGLEKYIVASSSPLPSFIGRKLGLMTSTSFVPDFYKTPPIQMNTMERATNLVGSFVGEWIFDWWFTIPTVKAIREVFPDYDNLEAVNKASYIFINADENVEFPQPITHKHIYIGGFGQGVVEPLNEKFKQILDSSNRGVVLISFGTIARSFTMPDEIKQAFLDAFSHFPDITFLWKYEREDGIAQHYPNVKIANWLPQAAILNHPKILAFLTHGGMNSISESVSLGVPMVSVALFADQTRNARMLVERKLGVVLDKQNLTKETITTALDKIINDKSYQIMAKETARMIREKPETADMRILRYTQFAADFDIAERIRMHGSKLNVIEYFNLDIIFAGLLSLFLSIALFLWILKVLVRRCFCKKVVKVQKIE